MKAAEKGEPEDEEEKEGEQEKEEEEEEDEEEERAKPEPDDARTPAKAAARPRQIDEIPTVLRRFAAQARIELFDGETEVDLSKRCALRSRGGCAAAARRTAARRTRSHRRKRISLTQLTGTVRATGFNWPRARSRCCRLATLSSSSWIRPWRKADPSSAQRWFEVRSAPSPTLA